MGFPKPVRVERSRDTLTWCPAMAFWCYILRCADGKYYTGHTEDLETRLAQRQHGGFCDFTARRRPVTLVWAADFPTRREALAAELRVGNWSRAKKEALIAQDWARLSFYARPLRERVSTSLDTNGEGSDIAGESFAPSPSVCGDPPVRVERADPC